MFDQRSRFCYLGHNRMGWEARRFGAPARALYGREWGESWERKLRPYFSENVADGDLGPRTADSGVAARMLWLEIGRH